MCAYDRILLRFSITGFRMLSATPIRGFTDNYIWLLESFSSRSVALVDPGDGQAALDHLRKHNLFLDAVLITHHHRDHVGGNELLKQAFPEVTIYGPASENIPAMDVALKDGDEVGLTEMGATLKVMDVPGHTAGHIAYLVEDKLFCSDTLFCGGCGRVFDDTFEDLAASLRRIATLPDDTGIYCAHEYTLDNLGFAQWVEPDNEAIKRRVEDCHIDQDADIPTVPSGLHEELATNPFLRTGDPVVIAAAEKWAGRKLDNPTEVFTALRQWKDQDYD